MSTRPGWGGAGRVGEAGQTNTNKPALRNSMHNRYVKYPSRNHSMQQHSSLIKNSRSAATTCTRPTRSQPTTKQPELPLRNNQTNALCAHLRGSTPMDRTLLNRSWRPVLKVASSMGMDSSMRRNVSPLMSSQVPTCSGGGTCGERRVSPVSRYCEECFLRGYVRVHECRGVFMCECMCEFLCLHGARGDVFCTGVCTFTQGFRQVPEAQHCWNKPQASPMKPPGSNARMDESNLLHVSL